MVGGVPVLNRWSIVPGFVLLWVFLTIYVLCTLRVIKRRRQAWVWEDEDECD